MTEHATKNTERWAYMGRRRMPHNGKVTYVWRTGTGDEGWYSKLHGTVIGGIYELAVEREGERTSAYPSTLKFTGDREEPVLRREWETAERVDMVIIERARQEKRLAGESEFEAAMVPLRELMAKQRTYTQRAALLALVLSEMGR